MSSSSTVTAAALAFLAGAAASVLVPNNGKKRKLAEGRGAGVAGRAEEEREGLISDVKRLKQLRDDLSSSNPNDGPRTAGGSATANTSSDDADNETTKATATENDCIYLDYNGTTPIYPEVVRAMMPFLTTHFGNPSSGHAYGRIPQRAVGKARKQILQLLDAPEDEYDTPESIIFTSCGTESDNLGIYLALASTSRRFATANGPNGELPHIVTSNVEHPAVEACLKSLERQKRCTVTYVPVQKDGRVLVEDVIDRITSRTVLVTLMLANNETGALQPVADVAKHCRQQGILIHTDASQAAGKVSVRLADLCMPDMVTLAGHKLGAPKGVACLYVRPKCLSEHQRQLDSTHDVGHGVTTVGGNQEFGLRAGTENVASIVGFGCAAEQAAIHWEQNAIRMEEYRTRLLNNLQDALGGDDYVRANGPVDPKLRLPNTLSVGIKGLQSGTFLKHVGDRVAASAGATCHSSPSCGVSSVLQAMHIPLEWARGTLRLSFGPKTTIEEIDRASQILAEEAKRQLSKTQ